MKNCESYIGYKSCAIKMSDTAEIWEKMTDL